MIDVFLPCVCQQLKRTRRDKVVVFWVSYLEAHQRVLLFTQDERVALQARRLIQSERAHAEVFVSLAGLGVSLNAELGPDAPPHAHLPARELAYLSFSDSAAVWEVSVAHRWKPLSLELASWIEDKWRHDHKKAQMKDFVHVSGDDLTASSPPPSSSLSFLLYNPFVSSAHTRERKFKPFLLSRRLISRRCT